MRAQISAATAKTKSIEDALQYELASDWSLATFDGSFDFVLSCVDRKAHQAEVLDLGVQHEFYLLFNKTFEFDDEK